MKETKIIMGMPITVEIVDEATTDDLDNIFEYFHQVDEQYSPYKASSELSKVNAGLPYDQWSEDFRRIIDMCENTRQETQGYFNIVHNKKRDPSGLVKGWAVQQAAHNLLASGFHNFYIEAGGDIQVYGEYAPGALWRVGIRNPYNSEQIVKVLDLTDCGIATSGTYIRGQHIYNPHAADNEIDEIKSLTVIGPDIYEADRFATAAFAMGMNGISFIEKLDGFEGYLIDDKEIATYTSGFEKYVATTH